MYTSKQVKELREARRISQRKLSQLTGLSPSLISAYEAGTRPVTAEASEKLDLAFKQVLPVQTPHQVTTAELTDPNTIIKVAGTPLSTNERELLTSVATTLVNQRK
jgi:transcriptional regulator with XRE-family HTH domain